MIEEDLIAFLQEGPKIGEQVFRDKFGYCPRGLLRVLSGTVLYKYKVGNKVAYRLMEDIFIQNNELDGLDLDYNEIPVIDFPKIDDIDQPKKTVKKKGFLSRFFKN